MPLAGLLGRLGEKMKPSRVEEDPRIVGNSNTELASPVVVNARPVGRRDSIGNSSTDSRNFLAKSSSRESGSSAGEVLKARALSSTHGPSSSIRNIHSNYYGNLYCGRRPLSSTHGPSSSITIPIVITMGISSEAGGRQGQPRDSLVATSIQLTAATLHTDDLRCSARGRPALPRLTSTATSHADAVRYRG